MCLGPLPYCGVHVITRVVDEGDMLCNRREVFGQMTQLCDLGAMFLSVRVWEGCLAMSRRAMQSFLSESYFEWQWKHEWPSEVAFALVMAVVNLSCEDAA